MKTLETYIALNRFGLGPAPGEAAKVEKDPREWVKDQIKRNQKTPDALKRFRSTDDIVTQLESARAKNKNAFRRLQSKAYRDDYGGEILSRAIHMIKTDTPLVERMVMFWSNHFTISTEKRNITPVTPAFEREAIRPHIFGKFEDMLKSAIRHPAMITYLDNQYSMGPYSIGGLRRRFKTGVETGLNENLAREILELHTLGVNGGYGQDDVIGLAKAISGWSHGAVRIANDKTPIHGRFEFKSYFHEPNSKYVLGQRYKDKGAKTGLNVLEDLARHPSTARFIATKLVRHFVSDEPPSRAVDEIAKVFLESKGDLADVSKALIKLPEVWANPVPKVKTHYEFMVSTFRVTGKQSFGPMDFIEPLREFGHVPFSAPSPAGWSDVASDWIAPESLMRRIEWARKYARTVPADIDPQKFLEDVVGPVASEQLRTWVSRAPTQDSAISLILTSPEFQRR